MRVIALLGISSQCCEQSRKNLYRIYLKFYKQFPYTVRPPVTLFPAIALPCYFHALLTTAARTPCAKR